MIFVFNNSKISKSIIIENRKFNIGQSYENNSRNWCELGWRFQSTKKDDDTKYPVELKKVSQL